MKKIITDLHIHSKYSRGCSRDLELPNIAKWCERKGIDLVTTGDSTHPQWLASIEKNLIETTQGFYQLLDKSSKTKFVIGTEISCIYKQQDKVRRLHLVLLFPNLEIVKKFNQVLTAKGCNLKSDGRPIIGLSAKQVAQLSWEINEDILIIPAHAWTPWFSIFGSKSGFNSVKECFEELSDRIYAIETGLSSDPKMNWYWSQLDQILLVSNSDAHSLANLGREANVFAVTENDFNYYDLLKIFRQQDKKNFLYTIEFFPEEGKYHLDGHADCHYSCLPEESKKHNYRCPKCGKLLTLGVLHRIKELADRQEINQENFVPYKSIIPLQEIIASVYDLGKQSKKVINKYLEITNKVNEFSVLLDMTESELKKIMEPELIEAIMKMRRGEIIISAGYDGIYGEIKLKLEKSQQTSLI